MSKEEEQTQPTVQTVQGEPEQDTVPPPTKSPFFEVLKTPTEQWAWVLWAQNGRAIAISAKMYDRRQDAIQSIEVLKQAITPGIAVLIAM